MEKSRKLIDLSKHKGRKMGEVRNRIRENLGDRLFLIKDFQTLQYEALLQISLVRRGLKNETASIEKAAKKVKDYFNIRKATLYKWSDDGVEEITTKEKTPLEFFNYWFLGFETTPYQELRYIETRVHGHLNEINDLIIWYETNIAITKYKEGKNPTGHEDRIIVDFYKRCMSERESILTYFLKGMRERAIKRANVKLVVSAIGIFSDFPYKSWRYKKEYFDCRRINSCSHRISDLPLKIGKELKSLYGSDTAKFYKKLFSIKKPKDIFRNIFFYAGHLPLKSNRNDIFKELESLYNGRRWLAFFALALPQVEGLFTEMLAAINPDEKGKSLTEKVEQIRPSYFLSDSYFDYYQYLVPRVRNEFMHTGHAENFRLKSCDLLTDIEHLLHVFYELDNPLVRIKRMFRQRDPMDFVDYNEFGKFFIMLEKIHSTHRHQIQSELEEFVNEFLLEQCQLEYIVQEATEALSNIGQEIASLFDVSFLSKSIPSEILKSNSKELKKILEKHSGDIGILVSANYELFEKAHHLKSFNHGLKKVLSNWNSKRKNQFLDEFASCGLMYNNAMIIKKTYSDI